MRKFFGLLSFLLVATAVQAIPVKRGMVRVIKSAEGKEIRAQLVGDEHAHYYRDAEGKTYVLKDGVAVETDVEQLLERAKNHRAVASKARKARRHVGGAGKVYEGKKKGLIILVEYTDVKFEDGHDAALYTRIANEKGFNDGDFVGSVSDYFLAQSGGRFELDFDVVGPVQLENKQSYYGGNNSNGDDKNPELMVVEGCKAVDDIVNFADYDWDGDGEVDQVFILYAGLGEANGGDEDTVWPHEWQLSESRQAFKLDGVTIDTYACSSELTGYDFDWFGNAIETGIDGIGTICHEFSHCLGFPDMYDTGYRYFGMGPWDLMDSGSYNGDGFCPAGYTSYEKMVAGWLTPIELTDPMDVEALQPLCDGGDAYIVYNKGHKEEFYLFENRQMKGWDSELPGEGLLVLHIDYDEDVWYNNEVNNASRQRCTIIPADNDLAMINYGGSYYVDDESLPGDPYPYEGNNTLSNTSKPKASTYNKNEDGKLLMNISVTDITQNADGTISFSFAEAAPTPKPEGVLFYESFDQCDDKGGNDGLWSNTIANGAFITDNEGWIAEKGYGANQCARFGTNKAAGRATTPVFTVDGEATLTFMAGAWDTSKDGTGMTIYTDEKNEFTADPREITMPKGQWGEFTVTLKGTGELSLTFLADNRFFLDEVTVVSNATGITQHPAPNTQQPTAVYDLQGRRVGSVFDELPRGIYVVGGKKVAK